MDRLTEPNPLVFWRFTHALSMASSLARQLWRSSIASQTAVSSVIWNLYAVSSQITLLLRTSYLITGPADTARESDPQRAYQQRNIGCVQDSLREPVHAEGRNASYIGQAD